MVHLIASINSLFWGSLLILLLVGTGIFLQLDWDLYKLENSERNKTINRRFWFKW